MRLIDFEKLESALLESLLSGDSVQDLFGRVYKCLGLPLICFDTTFHLVAYAFPRPFYYPNWECIAENGCAPQSDILGYNYLSYQEQMYENGRSMYFDSGTCEGFPQACGPVMIGGRLAAYCGIMIEDALKEEALRANDLLSRTTARIMQNLDRPGRHETAERLLIDNECGEAEAAELAAEFPPPYLFIIFSGAGCGVSTLEYVRGTLCTPNGGALGCLVNNERLFVLQSGVNPRSVNNLRASLELLAYLYGLECGVSDRFTSLGETSERRAQAMLALNAAPGRPGMRTFRRSYVEILERCALGWLGEAAAKLGCVENLAAADTDGELLNTLEGYLRSFRRPAEAADKLGLHRNTVLNRVRKLEELLGVDMSGAGRASALLTGIDLHNMTKGGGRS